jgi:hypothetical protein
MPGRYDCFALKTATSRLESSENSHSAARFSPTGVQGRASAGSLFLRERPN